MNKPSISICREKYNNQPNRFPEESPKYTFIPALTCGAEVLPPALGDEDEDGDDDGDHEDEAGDGDPDGEAPLRDTELVGVVLALNKRTWKKGGGKKGEDPFYLP